MKEQQVLDTFQRNFLKNVSEKFALHVCLRYIGIGKQRGKGHVACYLVR